MQNMQTNDKHSSWAFPIQPVSDCPELAPAVAQIQQPGSCQE